MAATGGLMFGYDVGVSGGVTSMPPFLEKFFPVVHRKTQDQSQTNSNYCKSLGRRPTMLFAGILPRWCRPQRRRSGPRHAHRRQDLAWL
ncbi:Sugar transport protein 13 [Linum perenne]